jgi:hypothetical protein
MRPPSSRSILPTAVATSRACCALANAISLADLCPGDYSLRLGAYEEGRRGPETQQNLKPTDNGVALPVVRDGENTEKRRLSKDP